MDNFDYKKYLKEGKLRGDIKTPEDDYEALLNNIKRVLEDVSQEEETGFLSGDSSVLFKISYDPSTGNYRYSWDYE